MTEKTLQKILWPLLLTALPCALIGRLNSTLYLELIGKFCGGLAITIVILWPITLLWQLVSDWKDSKTRKILSFIAMSFLPGIGVLFAINFTWKAFISLLEIL